ncbi:MAG: hypothetical protein M1834_006834 [Cirrosporium novae-zelandiae]|nr:MAG: hypothetical protein M1834_006834 [Cirrosporium novae-zelandiae]
MTLRLLSPTSLCRVFTLSFRFSSIYHHRVCYQFSLIARNHTSSKRSSTQFPRTPKQLYDGGEITEVKERRKNFAISLAATRPASVIPSDFISAVPTLPRNHSLLSKDLLILLTPKLATWLDDGFLTQVIKKLLPDVHESLPQKCAVAVVDRISAPEMLLKDHNTPGQCSDDNLSEAVVGFEGMSILGGVSGLTHKKIHPPELNIAFHANLEFRTLGPEIKIRRTNIAVPLANTLFVNGYPSTMFVASWQPDYVQDSTSICSIDLPPLNFISSPSVEIPLIPLTNAGVIMSSMGNIVRSITPSMKSKDPIPASQNLEAAVSKYFEVNKVPPHTLDVWALVIPREHYWDGRDESHWKWVIEPVSIPKLPLSEYVQSIQSRHIAIALLHGASVYKILSGGGGWGVKRGLLSLDPDEENIVNQDIENAFSDMITEIPRLRNFSDSRDGDIVQFYCCPKSEVDLKPISHVSEVGHPSTCSIANSDVFSTPPSCSFGTIPSDSPLPTFSSLASSDNANIITFYNHFGALSERAMRLTISSVDCGIEKHDARDVLKGRPSNRPKQKKIDVPFTRINF